MADVSLELQNMFTCLNVTGQNKKSLVHRLKTCNEMILTVSKEVPVRDDVVTTGNRTEG